MAQPSVLAPVKPYFMYAAQMTQSVPVMAYYCKLYAVQTGMGLCQKNPGEMADKGKAYLMQELQSLEEMKAAMGGISKDDALVTVENFILSVFARADNDERQCEKVGKEQAIAFKRSAHFIEVLTIWGVLSDEWQKRKKYSLFKAHQIVQAIKSGVEAPRGNPNEPEEAKNQIPPQQP